MLISLKWLNEYADVKDKSVQELEKTLTMIGQEVEKIEFKYEYLKTVITAKIVSYEKMENSDHLTICKVDTGSEILQVVCGAPNHKLGNIVALATIGTKFSDEFTIKQTKLRGVLSQGMLCSKKELSLGDDASGIIIFPEDTKLGIPLSEYFEKGDTVFELEITPNRPDCLSYLGIARELSSYYNIELHKPKFSLKEIDEKCEYDISIKDSNISNRYLARIVKNVKVGESPKWLKDKLEALGMKSINNIVDISNYVMLELGQPNHIFDLDKLNGNIEIRRAKKDEVFISLENKEYKLDENDIVVASGNQVVALAGVMGGNNFSVDENTKNILIETAHFDNIMVRLTSRKYAIFTESSYRFERWVNTNELDYASSRIASLLNEITNGQILKGSIDKCINLPTLPVTTLYLDKLARFVGKNIPLEKIVDIFTRLEIVVEKLDDNTLKLTPPTHRSDLLNAQDYYEEVIRLYGFDNIENVLPKLDIKKDRILDNTKLNYELKEFLASIGLNEVINYSFIPKGAFEKIKYEYKDVIEISNPITEDFAVMRPTFMYSLIKNVVDNFNRSVEFAKFFEVGKAFVGNEEITKLAIILAGTKPKDIYGKERQYDYYDMKGIVEKIFDKLNVSYQLNRSDEVSLHPGRSADIFVGKDKLGSFGNLHPDLEEAFDLEGESVIYCELDLDKIKQYIKNTFKYTPLSKYQLVTRDLAFVIKDDVLLGNVIKEITKVDKLINKVELFDIYKGFGIDNGYKSFAFKIQMIDNEKTLKEEEINEVIEKIKNKVINTYGAILRS